MKSRLSLVFLTLFLVSFVRLAGAVPPPLDHKKLKLASANVLVLDAESGASLYSKNPETVTPIASITKLMTAIVVIDGGQSMEDKLTVNEADVDLLRGSHSRLRPGTELTRREMLRLALMSSENRAASSLGRYYPGGTPAFVKAMNEKAKVLGMTHTHYADPTGLDSDNVSTAQDLATLVQAAAQYQLIHEFTTTDKYTVDLGKSGRATDFQNTNALVRGGTWDIELSKTGFIREAGRCLVMLTRIASKPVIIVLLDSLGTYTRIGDAMRVKYWLETGQTLQLRQAKAITKHGSFRRVSHFGRPVLRRQKPQRA